ncbi:hypothetical protein [Mitsuokella sp.]|nr:hypothetical protein [Mitsuokella sp.]MDY4474918.1 hypothetical protein [Mitsuokella sp.]
MSTRSATIIRQVVEAGDSPNARHSAAEGCTDFARIGRKVGDQR